LIIIFYFFLGRLFYFLAIIHEPHGPTPYSQYEHSSIPATVKSFSI